MAPTARSTGRGRRAASGRSMDPASRRPKAEDHGGREADLEEIAGEERHEPDAERGRRVAAEQRELRHAAGVDDDHAERAGAEHAERRRSSGRRARRSAPAATGNASR